jgi:hypothetical protein
MGQDVKASQQSSKSAAVARYVSNASQARMYDIVTAVIPVACPLPTFSLRKAAYASISGERQPCLVRRLRSRARRPTSHLIVSIKTGVRMR